MGPIVAIAEPKDVWGHVSLGSEISVSRMGNGDDTIYLSLESNCDWEEEHGLQIVFKEGKTVCKVGPFDGCLTNAEAYSDQSLVDVVYYRGEG